MNDTITVQAHFVTFYSPGTFVSEDTSRPIESWDIEAAKEMAHGITERYGATPYAFRFTTCGRGDADLNSKTIAESPLYHLGGKIETIDEVAERADTKEIILLANMRGNGWDRIVTNTNSYKQHTPLKEGDVVLEWTPRKAKAEARP